jgi:hypothetical protein
MRTRQLTVLGVVGIALLTLSCSSSGRKVGVEVDGRAEDVLQEGRLEEGTALDLRVEDQEAVGDAAPGEAREADIAVDGEIGTLTDIPRETSPEVHAEVVLPDVLPDELPDHSDLLEVHEDVLPLLETCRQFAECGLDLGCSPAFAGCWNACLDRVVPDALADWTTVTSCILEECGQGSLFEGDGCIWRQCHGPLAVCIGGEGSNSCGTVLSCITACPEEASLCPWDCLVTASPEALDALQQMMSQQSDSTFFAMMDCAAGSGSGDCYAAASCIQACAEQPQCLVGCFLDMSPEAAVQFKAMAECEEQDCVPAMLECVVGHGAASCSQAATCISGCPGPDSQACMMNCAASTSPKGAEDLLNTLECITEACGGLANPDQCPAVMTCMSAHCH